MGINIILALLGIICIFFGIRAVRAKSVRLIDYGLRYRIWTKKYFYTFRLSGNAAVIFGWLMIILGFVLLAFVLNLFVTGETIR